MTTIKKQEIITQVKASLELFHDNHHVAYALIKPKRKTVLIKSGTFRLWLTSEMRRIGIHPNRNALDDFVAALEAEAVFDGGELPLHQRVAKVDGGIYIDMGNEAGERVHINDGRYSIIPDDMPRFIRNAGSKPLPMPENGGNLNDLQSLVNYGDEDQWKLLLAWMVTALMPGNSMPILNLEGEQGCGKSTLSKILTDLIDPISPPLLFAPHNERDLMITANNRWLLCFDNLSGTKPWLSDALCRIATGGGFTTRKLHSDGDEHTIDIVRPILLNGIDPLATRSDLADRSIVLQLPVIRTDTRLDEAELWSRFETMRPKLLGALYLAIAYVLAVYDDITLRKKPRMTTFAKIGTALEYFMYWPDGSFMHAYERNIIRQSRAITENSPLYALLAGLLSQNERFEKTATELFEDLNRVSGSKMVWDRNLPRSAQSLSSKLRRMAPDLRRVGINIEFDERTADSRLIKVWRNNQGQEVGSGLDGTTFVDTSPTLEIAEHE